MGKMYYANGNVYKGSFSCGCEHGMGTMTYNNGDEYVGQFHLGFRSGMGTMTFANGEKYVGEWYADMHQSEYSESDRDDNSEYDY